MARIFVLIALFTLVVVTTPVLAQQFEQKRHDNKGQQKKETSTSLSATSSPSTQGDCDPSLEWKNHGEYVSCVARQHLGGKVTSEAAKSDIGKKNQVSSPSATPTPSASASASPSASVTPTASASATPEATSSGIQTLRSSIKDLIDTLKEFLKSLRFLF